jgi:hypothetical protein
VSSRCVGARSLPVAVGSGFGIWLASGCWRCLAPTLTVFDLVIMIMGQLARSGCRGGEGPAAKLEAA